MIAFDQGHYNNERNGFNKTEDFSQRKKQTAMHLDGGAQGKIAGENK